MKNKFIFTLSFIVHLLIISFLYPFLIPIQIRYFQSFPIFH